MDMRAETLIYDFHKFCDDLNEQFWWNMIIKRSNLIDRFLWTGLFAFEQISGFLIPFRVSVLHISFVPVSYTHLFLVKLLRADYAAGIAFQIV